MQRSLLFVCVISESTEDISVKVDIVRRISLRCVLVH